MSVNNFIGFSSTDIPTVARVIRNGLKAEQPSPIADWLETQIKYLEKEYGLIVQRQESLPLKQTDDGSNPSKPTIL